jgi:2-iminoacetate synthase ThiH
MGLDTLAFFATVRLSLAGPYILADFARLGHRLAQMALGFGANGLFGPIMPERALRLGANANNPVMTRKEAAVLLRGAGFKPAERLAGGTLEDVDP